MSEFIGVHGFVNTDSGLGDFNVFIKTSFNHNQIIISDYYYLVLASNEHPHVDAPFIQEMHTQHNEYNDATGLTNAQPIARPISESLAHIINQYTRPSQPTNTQSITPPPPTEAPPTLPLTESSLFNFTITQVQPRDELCDNNLKIITNGISELIPFFDALETKIKDLTINND